MSAKNKISQKKRQVKSVKKGVSIRNMTEKVIDIVKKPFTKNKTDNDKKKSKPFGGKGGRKHKPTEAELKRQKAEEKIKELENTSISSSDSEPSYSNVSSAFNGFFYTDEKFIAQFEDKEILSYIRAEHPEYNPSLGDESALKKAILSILADTKFMTKLLERYSMNIFDFFKFMFRIEPNIFKGTFITKVQKALKRKKYASTKRHCYNFTKKSRKSKRCKKQ